MEKPTLLQVGQFILNPDHISCIRDHGDGSVLKVWMLDSEEAIDFQDKDARKIRAWLDGFRLYAPNYPPVKDFN